MNNDPMNTRTYKKVSQNDKLQLINLVFQKGLKIKHASRLLNIKYAAAKLIIIHHRNNVILKHQELTSCLQTQVIPIGLKSNNTKIISKIGGKIVEERYYGSYSSSKDI